MSVQMVVESVAMGDVLEIGNAVFKVLDVHISQFTNTVRFSLDGHPAIMYNKGDRIMISKMALQLD